MGMNPPRFRLHVRCAMGQKTRAATAAWSSEAGEDSLFKFRYIDSSNAAWENPDLKMI